MGPDRPYPGNYAMGILFVMSIHMLFNGVAALLFPEIFETGYIGGKIFQLVYIGVGVLEFCMMLLLLIGSGIAYRITLITLAVIMALNLYYIFSDNEMGFDLGLQGILAVVAFLLLLTPSVRKFYRKISLGDITILED